jgi:uncharacterized protein with FMN-binding domain
MRRITLWLLSTVAALVLLFSYRTSTMGSGVAGTATGASGTAAGEISTEDIPAGTSDGSTASGGTSSGSAARTYQGSVVQTRWGPVQVRITVANGKITNVTVPTYPNGNHRDQEINSYALPILTQETMSAQSANIDTVSGATITSDGYIESLQAALDVAHLR